MRAQAAVRVQHLVEAHQQGGAQAAGGLCSGEGVGELGCVDGLQVIQNEGSGSGPAFKSLQKARGTKGGTGTG